MFRKFCSVIALISFLFFNSMYANSNTKYVNIYNDSVNNFIDNVTNIAKKSNVKIEDAKYMGILGDDIQKFFIGFKNDSGCLIISSVDGLISNLDIEIDIENKAEIGERSTYLEGIYIMTIVFSELGVSNDELQNKLLKSIQKDISKAYEKGTGIEKIYKIYSEKRKINLEINFKYDDLLKRLEFDIWGLSK